MISVPLPHLNAALIEPPFPHAFIVLGYQTAEDARAYFAGQTKPFAKIEEWLEENLPDARSVSAHDDFHGSLHVAIPDVADAVMFKLAWSEVILAPRSGARIWRRPVRMI